MKKIKLFCISFILLSFMLFSSVSFADSGNPFWDLLHPDDSADVVTPPVVNPPVITPPITPVVTIPSDTEKEPFLKVFLEYAYAHAWVLVVSGSNSGPYYSVDVIGDNVTCNEDETECCCKWEFRLLGNNTTTPIDGRFCIDSTYGITLKDSLEKPIVKCIGVSGNRSSNDLFPNLHGCAIDSPSIIKCQIFDLVIPE